MSAFEHHLLCHPFFFLGQTAIQMAFWCRKNYYKEGDYVYPSFDAAEAYKRALVTWANWIDKNLDPEKQLVFYRGYSSAHFRYFSFVEKP